VAASYAVPFVHRILRGQRKWPSESAPATVEPACAWHIIETAPECGSQITSPTRLRAGTSRLLLSKSRITSRRIEGYLSLGRDGSAVKPGIFLVAIYISIPSVGLTVIARRMR
jgi:hypothetical protein